MSTLKPCIFCDIVAGKSPETIIEFTNEHIVIFRDIRPASDHHYLAVPKNHMHNVRSLTVNDKDLSKLWKSFRTKSKHYTFIWWNFISFIFPAVLEMQNELRNLLGTKNVNLDDVSYGFHWPPFTSIDHLHMHAIAPASKMGFFARLVFKPINMWYCSVRWLNIYYKRKSKETKS